MGEKESALTLFVTSEKADQQTDVNKEPEGAILQIFCIE
jgi:hypothetical protein